MGNCETNFHHHESTVKNLPAKKEVCIGTDSFIYESPAKHTESANQNTKEDSNED